MKKTSEPSMEDTFRTLIKLAASAMGLEVVDPNLVSTTPPSAEPVSVVEPSVVEPSEDPVDQTLVRVPKTCRNCRVSLAQSDFSRDAKNSDGLKAICKKCDKIRRSNRRATSIEVPRVPEVPEALTNRVPPLDGRRRDNILLTSVPRRTKIPEDFSVADKLTKDSTYWDVQEAMPGETRDFHAYHKNYILPCNPIFREKSIYDFTDEERRVLISSLNRLYKEGGRSLPAQSMYEKIQREMDKVFRFAQERGLTGKNLLCVGEKVPSKRFRTTKRKPLPNVPLDEKNVDQPVIDMMVRKSAKGFVPPKRPDKTKKKRTAKEITDLLNLIQVGTRIWSHTQQSLRTVQEKVFTDKGEFYAVRFGPKQPILRLTTLIQVGYEVYPPEKK